MRQNDGTAHPTDTKPSPAPHFPSSQPPAPPSSRTKRSEDPGSIPWILASARMTATPFHRYSHQPGFPLSAIPSPLLARHTGWSGAEVRDPFPWPPPRAGTKPRATGAPRPHVRACQTGSQKMRRRSHFRNAPFACPAHTCSPWFIRLTASVGVEEGLGHWLGSAQNLDNKGVVN